MTSDALDDRVMYVDFNLMEPEKSLNARPLPPLPDPRLYADYSVVTGMGGEQISTYALFATWGERATASVDARCVTSITKYMPECEDPTGFELHATKLMSGQWRERNGLVSILPRQNLNLFFDDLSFRLARVRYSALVLGFARTTTLSDPSHLLNSTISVLRKRLMQFGWTIGDCQILIDRGDAFRLRQGVFGMPSEHGGGLDRPRYRLVDSADYRGVQVADMAALFCGYMVKSHLASAAASRAGQPADSFRYTARLHRSFLEHLDAEIFWTGPVEEFSDPSSWPSLCHQDVMPYIPDDPEPASLTCGVRSSYRANPRQATAWRIDERSM
ncbi:hypothetical protein [Aquipuribacter hungaricus]|uniref:Uncharacterized protein n=1 Tax=Aquipuribacter hungaricus TaxID=545624 RepID=A0ABV7WN31_9MICO